MPHYCKKMETSNGMFSYNEMYFDMTLKEWVQTCYVQYAKHYGWTNTLKPGCYGFDNFACSIAFVLRHVMEHGDTDIETAASLVHDGWCVNFLEWHTIRPWKYEYGGRTPRGIDDPARVVLAHTPYADLSDEEKKKDLIIAQTILDNLASRCNKNV